MVGSRFSKVMMCELKCGASLEIGLGQGTRWGQVENREWREGVSFRISLSRGWESEILKLIPAPRCWQRLGKFLISDYLGRLIRESPKRYQDVYCRSAAPISRVPFPT